MNTKRGAFEENLFSRMEAQNNLLKGRNISVLEKEIWNAAIEKVIELVDDFDRGVSPRSDIVPEIRKLKV